jgi:hypothetical protein
MKRKKITLIILPILCLITYLTLTSSSTGVSGLSQSGCSCHAPTASATTLVTITGLPAGGYTNGAVYPITLSVTNNTLTPSSFGLRDGFNMSATTGSFTAIAGTALVSATEIRHTTPKAVVAGTASWTFNWTAPATGNANVTFFAAGNATNGNGQSTGDAWNLASQTIFKSGATLGVTATASTISCNGGTSTITASGSGPTPPYNYALNAGSFQATNTFAGNLAGTYTVTVRDATLATQTTSITIAQPTAIVVSATATTINCNGGTAVITASATGGTGTKTYRLNSGAFQSSAIFNNNLAGTFTITARDANLCTKTTTVVITQPTALTFTAPVATGPTCNGGANGSISTTANGGTGSKTYTISPLGPQSNSFGGFSGLTAQGYTITVTDANSCTKTTAVTLTAPSAMVFGTPTLTPPLCIGGTGSASVTATGGTGTKTYSINPLGPQTNTSGNFTGLTAQNYTITVVDANNCTKTTAITIDPGQISCNINMNVKFYLQGYYIGAGDMSPSLFNQGVSTNSLVADSAIIELRDPSSPFAVVQTFVGEVGTNGVIAASFPTSVVGNAYYIVVQQRNHIQTWSANPVTIVSNMTYDFSTAATQAYGSNQIEVETGVFGFYTGDINFDFVVDAFDYIQLDQDLSAGAFGYIITDLTGDGNVDAFDYLMLDPNLSNGVSAVTP